MAEQSDHAEVEYRFSEFALGSVPTLPTWVFFTIVNQIPKCCGFNQILSCLFGCSHFADASRDAISRFSLELQRRSISTRVLINGSVVRVVSPIKYHDDPKNDIFKIESLDM